MLSSYSPVHELMTSIGNSVGNSTGGSPYNTTHPPALDNPYTQLRSQINILTADVDKALLQGARLYRNTTSKNENTNFIIDIQEEWQDSIRMLSMPETSNDREIIQHMETLIKDGAHINATNKNHETALYAALLTQKYEAMKWLLEHGAKIDIPNTSLRQSPLHGSGLLLITSKS